MNILLRSVAHNRLLWLLVFVPGRGRGETWPVLVLLSHFIGPSPMDLQFWPGAVA